jgi:type III restriction enzyme
MKQVVIENPVLNSAFTEPRRHYRFTDEGITDEKVESRRISSYFVPVPQPRKRGKDKQLVFETEWTKDRIEENKFINQVRTRVALWRQGNYTGITKTTRRSLRVRADLHYNDAWAPDPACYLTDEEIGLDEEKQKKLLESAEFFEMPE